MTGACFALAGLTLLLPSVPSYDPWAWLIWGREVVHLDLHTTTGPSWKPLPVLLTAPYSLAGPAAPELWLITARAATLGAVVAAFAVADRLGGRVAGALAATLLFFFSQLWGTTWTGNSEGILILCVLGAAHRQLAGREGQAFSLAVAAGLLRPEVWPFLGLYAVWLAATDRRRLPWLAVGLALIPALWLLPELWGSGSLSRGADRARLPGAGAPALTASPALSVVKNAVRLAGVPVVIGLIAWAVAVVRGRERRAEVLASLTLGALALAWVAVVAAMSELGFSGISRYLLAPVGIACVLAGLGLGWLVDDRSTEGRKPWPRILGVGTVVLLTLVLQLTGKGLLVEQLTHEAAVLGELDAVIEKSGGERGLDLCGPLYASFQTTPSIAWTLERHLEDVSPYARPPGTVMRARLLVLNPIDPPPTAMEGAAVRVTRARTTYWHVEATCRHQAKGRGFRGGRSDGLRPASPQALSDRIMPARRGSTAARSAAGSSAVAIIRPDSDIAASNRWASGRTEAGFSAPASLATVNAAVARPSP